MAPPALPGHTVKISPSRVTTVYLPVGFLDGPPGVKIGGHHNAAQQALDDLPNRGRTLPARRRCPQSPVSGTGSPGPGPHPAVTQVIQGRKGRPACPLFLQNIDALVGSGHVLHHNVLAFWPQGHVPPSHGKRSGMDRAPDRAVDLVDHIAQVSWEFMMVRMLGK